MKNTIYYLNDKEQFIAKVVEMPTLKNGYVRVKNLYCGICGGDYSAYIGRRNKYNISLGHEFVSKVIAAGEGINGFKPDIVVISDFNYRCGRCSYCLAGQSHLCDENNIELFSNRAFAEYSDIHYSYLLAVDLPDNNLISATCIEPLSCVMHAVNCVPIKLNERVLIVGNGNIGTLTAFYLKAILHIEDVYVIDIINQKSNRLIDFFDCKPYEDDINFNVIFEATNEVEGLVYAISKSRRGGRVCSVSHLYGLDTSLPYNEIIKNEIDIKYPLRNGDKSNLVNAAQHISRNWRSEYNSMFKIFAISSINDAFRVKSTTYYNRQIISMI